MMVAMAQDGSVGRVRSRIRHGKTVWYLDFGRRAEPRYLYSYRGTRIESEEAARGFQMVLAAEVAAGRRLRDVVMEVGPQGGDGPSISGLMDEWVERFEKLVRAGERSGNSLREIERWADVGGDHGYLRWWDGVSLFTVDWYAVETWSLWMAERGLSGKTRRNVMAAFHSFCVWANHRFPTWTIPDFPWPEADEYIPRVISLELQQKILDAIPEPKRGAFLACARLALRPNEARVTRVADWRGDTLRIHRGQKDRLVGGREGGTKKRRGAKILPVEGDLRTWLERYGRGEPGDYLFRNPSAANPAKQWSETAMKRTWTKAVSAAGVPPVSLYEGTKHTLMTALKNAGADDRVLAQLAGHSDFRSVERYARLGTDLLRSTLRRIK